MVTMKTIAVLSCKGGAGKTTISVNLAISAHLAGLKTVLADCDRQRSATICLQARTDSGPDFGPVSAGALLQHGARAEMNGFNVRIIDTPASPNSDLIHAINAADLCLVVCRPTFLDLASALNSATLLRQLRKPGAVVLNQTQPSRGGVEHSSVGKAIRALALTDLPLATIVASRVAYQTSFANGLSAAEMKSPAAEREVATLWETAQRLMENSTSRPLPRLVSVNQFEARDDRQINYAERPTFAPAFVRQAVAEFGPAASIGN